MYVMVRRCQNSRIGTQDARDRLFDEGPPHPEKSPLIPAEIMVLDWFLFVHVG